MYSHWCASFFLPIGGYLFSWGEYITYYLTVGELCAVALKRTIKRKSKEPHTKISDMGLNKLLTKIDRAVKTLDNRR